MKKLIEIEDIIENTNILQFFEKSEILQAKSILPMSRIEYADNIKETKNSKIFYFVLITYSYGYYKHNIEIEVNENSIIKANCSCGFFKNNGHCVHIPAVILEYVTYIFPFFYKSENVSNKLLEFFLPKNQVNIKKQVFLELKLSLNSNYYYNFVEPKISIGESRLYALNPKINAFKDSYEDNYGEVKFGKNFTYNPENNYFNEEDRKVLDAFIEYSKSVNGRYHNEKELKIFLSRVKQHEMIVNNYKIEKIIEGFPLKTKLIKENDNYRLNIDKSELFFLIENDFEYLLYQGKLYHLNKKERDLIETLVDNNINDIYINKSKIEDFTKGLMGIIKDNMDIDSSVDDIVVTKNIMSELYFDIRKDYIICEVKFIYDKEVVGYFDSNSVVLRDMEYETGVINDLLMYAFEIKENKFILTDLEQEVSFIENGLEKLASKYVVYTTEKFKKMNIRKKTNITSTFSIGKDNILSFDFSLGDISSDELVNIFKGIKNKKKYYKLKNGDILNLEDESLQQLEDLTEELELSDEEIINGKGSVLKYRAIYLDSLKNTKYNIVKTDNLFDNLIKNFYAYKDSDLSLKNLEQLRNYQITGVKWLYNLDKTGFGGILADEMGLGKTIQIIYYIKEMLLENENYKFLIIVPTSLAYNWEHEFDMFAPEIKKEICVGNKKKRLDILSNENYNVLVTTYGMLREDEALYLEKNFHAVIIDEAQNIKNNMAGITRVVKSIKGDVKFALTGTPLENSILELWSIFDFVMPGYLTSLVKFQSKYRIKDFDENTNNLLKGLSHQINPFILRRRKKDVVKELPDKLINDIYIELSEEQKKLYAAELENVKKEMEEILLNGGMSKIRFLILQLLIKLRQICIDPAIIYDDYKGGSNKIDTLVNIINEYIANGHKILIFSSFKTALDLVKRKLESLKINYYSIDGSVSSKNRINMVDNFNLYDDVKVFLITLKAGGTGLNLASADVVIHLDLWWNPQAENQATDRAHRIGQKNKVEVIHLISKGTIEEKILELQNKKRLLSDKLIDGEIRDKNILSTLTEEDIRNLLAYENKE